MKVKIRFEIIVTPYTEKDLLKDIDGYRKMYKDTFTSYGKIVNLIRKVFYNYYNGNGFDCPEDEIHIPVCSDWLDKVYVFETVRAVMIDNVLFFKVMYKGIHKL